MAQMRTIEIDFDVHKCIENERRSFDEHPNLALRRLLKLPSPPKNVSPALNAKASIGRAWTEDGVTLAHGTLVRMLYDRKRQRYEGRIEDGKWALAGSVFDSPSGAASELAVTKKGKKTKLNGWLYFEVMEPGSGKWVPLTDLRRHKRPSLTVDEMGL